MVIQNNNMLVFFSIVIQFLAALFLVYQVWNADPYYNRVLDPEPPGTGNFVRVRIQINYIIFTRIASRVKERSGSGPTPVDPHPREINVTQYTFFCAGMHEISIGSHTFEYIQYLVHFSVGCSGPLLDAIFWSFDIIVFLIFMCYEMLFFLSPNIKLVCVFLFIEFSGIFIAI